MTHTEFCYWLQGHFELNGDKPLSEEQVKIIREHLALTFNKVTGETLMKYVQPLKPIKGEQWITCSLNEEPEPLLLASMKHGTSC